MSGICSVHRGFDPGCTACSSSVTRNPETTEAARALAWISSWLDGSYPPVDAKTAAEWREEALLWRRTTKGAEEAGEVQSALRGLIAENPRKGQTHTADDVIGELLDAAVSALGAVEHMTGNEGRALPLLFEKIAKIRARADSAVLAVSPAVTEGERPEMLHWSHYEDDDCIEECPGCLRERMICALWPDSDSLIDHGVGTEGEAEALVDRFIAAVRAEPNPHVGPVVLDLDDRIYDGQTLPDVTESHQHVHSTTGVCVKHPLGEFCPPAATAVTAAEDETPTEETRVWTDAEMTEALRQRDEAEEWADRLASTIARAARVDIGEHTSANNPWANALHESNRLIRDGGWVS